MPGTAAMDPRDAAFSSGDDDGIVITLIDSRHFPILAEVASRNIVMVKDLSVASGLLILPPVQDTLDAFPHATLVDLCYERRVGMVTSRMAKEMRHLSHYTGPSATEAAFERFLVTPHMLDVADVALGAVQEQGGNPDLNDKSVVGVQVLMMSLVRRWACHMEVVGQPDEAKVGSHLSLMTRLRTVIWNHPPVQSPEVAGHPTVYKDQICYNTPGVQGLALGRQLGKSVRLSITGMSLAGFESRIALYVTNCRAAGSSVLRDREKSNAYQISKGMHYLASSVMGLANLQFVVHTSGAAEHMAAQQYPRPTSDDMAALKRLMLAAHELESLAIVGDPSAHSDGFAGGNIPGGTHDSAMEDRPSGREFYLPPFRFSPGERLPPLHRLHLWRYDWRCHSADDVAVHWDLSQLRSLVFDGAPLRWFLGTLVMDQMRNLSVLRIEDAEWGLQPGEARQAALMLSLMLSHHIERLEWLELIGVYTDNLPVAAIRRHLFSLERLVLRHPYGLRPGVDAVTPSAAPVLLLALLQQGEDLPGADMGSATNGDLGGVVGSHEDAESFENGVVLEASTEINAAPPPTCEDADVNSDEEEERDGNSEFDTPSTPSDVTAITPPPSESDERQSQQRDQHAQQQPSENHNRPHVQDQTIDGRLAPVLSRLVSVELDMDERHMEQDDEPEVLTRLARLPMLRNVSLAVPSVLRNLYCVPKYDVDLHNALQRLLFVLSQRQERMFEQQNAARGSGRGRVGPSVLSLEQVTFFIDGFRPLRSQGPRWDEDWHGARPDEVEEGNIWEALREPHTAEAETLHTLMASLVTHLAHNTASDQATQSHEGSTSAATVRAPTTMPTLAVHPLPEGSRWLPFRTSTEPMTMSSIIGQGPTTQGLSFLQPHEANEVDATPGIAQALFLRSQDLRPQRCIIAEMATPTEDSTTPNQRRQASSHTPAAPDREVDVSDDEDDRSRSRSRAQQHNSHDSSRLLKYHLYEEFACYADEQSPDLTYYQRRDLRENNLRPRQRMRLPFVVHFELPANLPTPRWDVLGVPLYM